MLTHGALSNRGAGSDRSAQQPPRRRERAALAGRRAGSDVRPSEGVRPAHAPPAGGTQHETFHSPFSLATRPSTLILPTR